MTNAKRMNQAMTLAAEYRRVRAAEGPNARTAELRNELGELVGHLDAENAFRLPRPVLEAMGLTYAEILKAVGVEPKES